MNPSDSMGPDCTMIVSKSKIHDREQDSILMENGVVRKSITVTARKFMEDIKIIVPKVSSMM